MLDAELCDAPARKLRSHGPLSTADESVLAGLCHTVRAMPRRRDVLSPGTETQYVHILLSGWAARYSILADGVRRITALLLPGDTLDLHGAWHAPVAQSVTALTDCTVSYIPASGFEQVVAARPSLARALWRSSLIDESITRQWLASTGRTDARTAVARLICELHARLRAIGLADRVRLPFPMRQKDLGDATGMTAVHVKRTMRVLREERLIDRVGSELFLRDVDQLRRLAAFSPDYLRMIEDPERYTNRRAAAA